VTGLVMVALPLIIVLVSSEVLMSRLARHSSVSVYRAVTAGQLSQELVEQILNLERRVRQYKVLGDGRLLADVVSRHRDIQKILSELSSLPYQPELLDKIRQVAEVEDAMLAALNREDGRDVDATAALHEFEVLNALSREIYDASIKQAYHEAAALQSEAGHAKSTLLWLATAMLLLTMALAFYFSRLIAKPIKELDSGINRLGQGDFVTPVKVAGPEDLMFLGKRLDWLREKLAAFEKNKSKFAAHVSHELKTPLASIREGAELLADEVAGPLGGKQREIVEILKKNCTQLYNLIENLLGFTMAEARKTSLHPGLVKVAKVVDDVVTAHKPLVLKNRIEVEISVEDVTIEADPELFHAIINNLFSNAVKYSPVGGRVEVSAMADSESLFFDIIDNGPGIGEEEEKEIFRPFFQGQATCRTPIKGTGLGLAIALEYAKAHGGSLSLLRDREKGCHFQLVLPLTFRMESEDALEDDE